MQKLIIDRFEGNYAVCETENKDMLHIEISRMPEGANESSCIIIDEDGSISLDEERSEERRKRISKMMKDLFE